MSWNEKGPGRKQCPACKLYIGVRCLKCECGQVFEKAKLLKGRAETARREMPQGEMPQRETVQTEMPQRETVSTEIPQKETAVSSMKPRRPGCFVVIAPAGKCPVELSKADEASILQWAKAVRATTNDILTVEALLLYARQFFFFETPEYETIERVLFEKGGEE